MFNFTLPEILSPAGNLDKLKTSVLYGADAVYLAGQNYGLRTAADNFTEDEIIEGLQFAHDRGVKCYVTLNAFLHDQDLEKLPPFLSLLESTGTDAVIVSDLGVIDCVQKYSGLPIHLSTQASCLNTFAGDFWKGRGVKRLILGREVSIEEANTIKKETGLEVEVFVHGAMCMAYSGHCTISNFTRGRDSNRGGCAQSCRFDYSLDLSSSNHGRSTNDPANQNDSGIRHSFFLSSKDLAGVQLIPELLKSNIDSVKIEGRMKSSLYTAVVTRVYREAFRARLQTQANTQDRHTQDLNTLDLNTRDLVHELSKVANRTYTSGNLRAKAGIDSIIAIESNAGSDTGVWSYAGDVLEVVKGEFILLEVRNAFDRESLLELLPWTGPPIPVPLDCMTDVFGNPVERSNVNHLVRIPFIDGVEKRNVARMKGH